MKSPAYWHPLLYKATLRFIYRKSHSSHNSTFLKILAWVARNSDVVEVAAGTADCYRMVLKPHVQQYRAIERNPAFVSYLKNLGITVFQHDLRSCELPEAETYLALNALYNFKEYASELVQKMVAAAKNRVIILEPVGRQLSRKSCADRLRAWLVDNGEGPVFDRLTSEELLAICSKYGRIVHVEHLPGNDDLLVIESKK